MDPQLDISEAPRWMPVADPSLPAGVGVEPLAPAAAAAAAAAAAGEADASTARLTAAIRLSVLPCQACRASRVKCVGSFPCNRCFDLGHTCVPRSDTGAGNIGRQSASDKDEEEEQEPAAVVARKLAGFAQSPSPMDLAYLISDPLPFAELYARACVRVFEEGQCSRSNVLRFLRKWRRESLLMGADVTLGVAKVLQERAGIAPIELVGREELLHGPTDAARRARLAAEQAEQAGRARELLEWDAFKRASLGGAAAFCIAADAEGRHVDVANPEFLRLAGGAGWQMQTCKMLSCFVAASICAPVDREALLQAVAENSLDDQSGTGRRTRLLKFYMGNGLGPGRVGLVIATFERVELEDGHVGLITRIEPAPPSRHLTARPSSPEAVRPLRKGRPAQRRYKKGYRQSTLADAAAAAAAAGASPAAGREQQAQGPGAFAFPAMAAAPGLALPAGGADALLDAAAEALFARRARQEEKEQPAAAAAVAALPSTEPGVRRRTHRRRAATAGAGGGGESSEAAGAGGQVHRAPASPGQPLAPLVAEQGHVYEGPFTLGSEDWPGFLQDEELLVDVDGHATMGFGGSPMAMEDVFKDG